MIYAPLLLKQMLTQQDVMCLWIGNHYDMKPDQPERIEIAKPNTKFDDHTAHFNYFACAPYYN